MNIKHLLISLVIAILFTIFIQSIPNAAFGEPEYNDFCKDNSPRPVKFVEENECINIDYPEELADSCKGKIEPIYTNGCIIEYTCETCYEDYDSTKKSYNFKGFILTTIIGIVGIIGTLFITKKKDIVVDYLKDGFLLGGLLSIFISTIRFWDAIISWWRPITLAIEIILVIVIVLYKKKEL